MRRRTFALFLAVCRSGLAQAQQPGAPPPEKEGEARLPNGKIQRDEILKAEYLKSVQDAEDLARIAEELKQDLDKATAFVVSVQTIKRTEEIEKLARRIRGRLKRN